MKTSSFIYPLTGMAALASLASCGSEKEAPKQYNIVYIMTDDHTAQMMSCYGSRFVETPNLDRIANDGVIFTNSFVANSLSGPSRACMLTGKHSHANGFTDNTTCVFDGSQQTMPKLLQKAGYQTAIIGKWHLISLLPDSTTGKLCPNREIITIRISSRWIMTPSARRISHQSDYRYEYRLDGKPA